MESRPVGERLGFETKAHDLTMAREIVLNLGQLGLSNAQRLLIINGLAMELEDVGQMKAITAVVRDVGGDAFLAPVDEGEQTL